MKFEAGIDRKLRHVDNPDWRNPLIFESIAMSLKRIADLMENKNESTASPVAGAE